MLAQQQQAAGLPKRPNINTVAERIKEPELSLGDKDDSEITESSEVDEFSEGIESEEEEDEEEHPSLHQNHKPPRERHILNQNTETSLTHSALSAQERHLLYNPCDSILRGDKTVEESLGWIFKVNHLKNLKALNVPQGASGDAISGEAVREAEGSAGNVCIEPSFVNSRRLNNSLLQPIKRHRQNRESVFETNQQDSGLWRAMIETTAPVGLNYVWQSLVQWKTLTGPSAIPQRLKSLEVFGQQPDSRAPPVIPRHSAETLSSHDRRRLLREEIFARLRKVWSSQFCKLLGVWHNWLVALRHCTLQNLIANEATLEQLFANTKPSGSSKHVGLTITDFIVLFDLDGVLSRTPESEEMDSGQSPESKKTGKNSPTLRWLYDLKHKLDLHFTYKTRFPVGVLTREPFNITWSNFVRPKLALRDNPYGRLQLFPGFFHPDEMAKLNFSFASELKKYPSEFTYEIFRLMAHKGSWKYEDLYLCLDFTWDIIKDKLELTKSDLSSLLGWTKDPDPKMLTKEEEPRLPPPADPNNHWITLKEYSKLSSETIPMPKYTENKKAEKKKKNRTLKKKSSKK
jgi:hypothetical protein